MLNTKIEPKGERWFIWTMVFLLVSGVSLVSYIMITDIGNTQVTDITASFIKVRHR